MELNKEQIKRLYDVFDFDDNEEIVTATEENHQFEIYYIDGDGITGCYKPYLLKHSREDKEKYNHIMNG